MKRIVILTWVLVLLLAAPIHAAGPFSDVRQTDWFASYVETARDLGIVSGYPDGRFQPSRQVTYGEFLAMAMRGKALPDNSFGHSADPYKVHWARKFYDAAVAADVFEEQEISPRFLDEAIPRSDMALVMAGLLRNAELSGRNVRTADKLFSDVAADDAREYPIALCAYYGVLAGYPDGTFRKDGYLKRSEAAAAMVALDGVLQQAGVTVPEEPAPEPSQLSPGTVPSDNFPKTREELLQRNEEHALVRTGDDSVLGFMDPAVRSYLQEVVSSARFVKEGGAYLVRLTWPALPEGCGGKIDVQVCDKNGTGLDGYVWVCRKGMEQIPTYRKDLREKGEAEFAFDFGPLSSVGSVSLLVTVTAENGKAESSLALAQQDLTTGKSSVQYKLASETYQLSGTFDLDAPVFQWK
ncbi:MAG: S-layer homology domain-containing protein [Firmicutes bacterium]|nr:S-layer homology domain-containing protein [Bacillota bacterium]